MNAEDKQPADPADRIRLIIDTTEERRRAVRMAAAREGISLSAFINAWIDRHLAEDLEEIRSGKKKRKS